MRITFPIPCCLLVLLMLFSSELRAQEKTGVASTYQRIVADYQQLSALGNTASKEAAARLARDAYRLLIEEAGDIAELNADDLYALGACHEQLANFNQANEMFTRSLAKMDVARTRLGLVRANLVSDLTVAEEHFAAALKMQPEYAGISQFHVLLSAAHQRQRDWGHAIGHLETYLAYTKSLVERRPGNRMAQQTHAAVQSQLDRVRIFSGMMGKPLQNIEVKSWIQGDPIEIASLKEKVVVIDFFAPWSEPSRNRMNLLKELHAAHGDKGLEIIGLTRSYRRRWDAASDSFPYDGNLTPEAEQASIAAFAKENGIGWRLGVIDPEVADEFGVYALPHSVIGDKAGNVKLIMLSADEAGETELKEMIVGAIGADSDLPLAPAVD